MVWIKGLALVLGLLTIVVVSLAVYGSWRWVSGTQALRTRIESARVPPEPSRFNAHDLVGLPPPVQRYFRIALKDGQPVIASVKLAHEGQFNMSEKNPKWIPFTSNQFVVVRRPGFDWDARISMAPGVKVFVHDAYVAGEGILHAALLGLIAVADLRGTPEVAQGELMRFLAEAAWYPTALLPSQGVRWEGIDNTTARATLTDGATAATLNFRFDADGFITGVRAAARHRVVDGVPIATPWQGRFWNYAIRDGMHIPLEGEVAWELPSGPLPYWRGRLTEATYELAR
jgi:hypothetical protein